MLNNIPTQIAVVCGDDAYQLNFTLQDASGTVVNLTGATVTFNAQYEGDASVNTSGAMTIVVAANGTCYYAPNSSDFPQAGIYQVQIVVNYSSSGEQITFAGIQLTATARVS